MGDILGSQGRSILHRPGILALLAELRYATVN